MDKIEIELKSMNKKENPLSKDFLLNHLKEKTETNYNKIEKYLQHEFYLPEFDSLVFEISICLLVENYQAAITLTNHLLEKTLKYGLIYFTAGKNKDFDKRNEEYNKAIDKFGSIELEDTINRCCSVGLISKKEKENLKYLKNKYRNSFSHADIKKTFGNISAPITFGNFLTGNIESKMVKISQFIFLHGVVQAQIAEQSSPIYFDYVYDILTRMLEKIFPQEEGEE